MEVIRASVMGFCMGVRRAVEKAEQALAECGPSAGGEGRVCSLGPLIHNPTVLADLERRGLSVLSPDAAPFAGLEGASVVIRAHGTTPQVTAALERAGARVIDATCPKVHLSQKRVREWSGKGYGIVIAGDRNHGEVTGVSSFACAGSRVSVVQDAREAEALVSGKGLPDKAVLIAQTTFSPSEFARISGVLRERIPGLVVFDSICSATMERQDALVELASRVDGIIVIGGKSSANTRRLYERARSLVPLADLIEDASMIRREFFSLPRVGITAGASTPEAVIRGVEEALRA